MTGMRTGKDLKVRNISRFLVRGRLSCIIKMIPLSYLAARDA